jgi:hypothetical protein
MSNKYKFLTLSISMIILSPTISATAQPNEIVRGKYIYRLLDAQGACVSLAGRQLGANQVIEAWHSPVPGNHNRCKYQYITTWQNEVGWNAGGNAGIVNGGVNGSHSDNGNTSVKEDVINISRNYACSQQQGTPRATISRSGYIYCIHNR